MFRSLRDLILNTSLDDEDAALEEIAQRLVGEGMGAAAIVFFETSKPIGFIAGQAAIAATPFIGGFIEPIRVEKYASLMANRDFVERLIVRIEELEAERAGKPRDKSE